MAGFGFCVGWRAGAGRRNDEDHGLDVGGADLDSHGVSRRYMHQKKSACGHVCDAQLADSISNTSCANCLLLSRIFLLFSSSFRPSSPPKGLELPSAPSPLSRTPLPPRSLTSKRPLASSRRTMDLTCELHQWLLQLCIWVENVVRFLYRPESHSIIFCCINSPLTASERLPSTSASAVPVASSACFGRPPTSILRRVFVSVV